MEGFTEVDYGNNIEKYYFADRNPLRSGDRSHRIRAYLALRMRQNEGPVLFGRHVLEDTDFSITYRYNSGRPFSYVPYYVDPGLPTSGFVGNERWLPETTFDFQVKKWVNILGFRPQFFVRVENLFNNRHYQRNSSDFYDYNDYNLRNMTANMDPIIDDTSWNVPYINFSRRVFLGFGISL